MSLETSLPRHLILSVVHLEPHSELRCFVIYNPRSFRLKIDSFLHPPLRSALTQVPGQFSLLVMEVFCQRTVKTSLCLYVFAKHLFPFFLFSWKFLRDFSPSTFHATSTFSKLCNDDVVLMNLHLFASGRHPFRRFLCNKSCSVMLAVLLFVCFLPDISEFLRKEFSLRSCQN